MKRIVTLIIIYTFSTIYTQAQVSFSSNYREFCYWNESTKKFGDCDTYEDPSLFEMNENETMFTHTTSKSKTTYYIRSSDYLDVDEAWIYDTTSDAGNSYLFVFRPSIKQIRVLPSDDPSFLIIFHIKAIF